MTPDDSLADWLAALAMLGVTHEPDCPFLLWVGSVDPSRPVAALLAKAPPARRLEAALRVLESAPPDWPRAWWREIVLQSEASEAVKRWAGHKTPSNPPPMPPSMPSSSPPSNPLSAKDRHHA